MKTKLLLAFLCLVFGLTSCDQDEPYYTQRPIPGPAPADTASGHPKTNRTVLAYFVGDISLWDYLEKSLNQMEMGWDPALDGTLLVYLDNSKHLTQFGQPVLLEITHDETEMIASKVVKTYPDQDAVDPDVMQGVLNDAIHLYPAESHGLIIGTHADAWIPDYVPDAETKSLAGADRYGSVLQIDELAELLPLKYDFILFHACLMANVETAYQLRNKCEYLIGSAFSLHGHGYPYEQIIPFLYTKPKADLYKTTLVSYTEYATQPDLTQDIPFSIEVIKTSKLENLAATTSKLLDDMGMSYAKIRKELYKDRELLAELPVKEKNYVIQYDDYGMLIDLKGLCFVIENEELTRPMEAALDEVVIQHYVAGNTSAGWKLINTNLGSGLSFYLPYKEDTPEWNQLNKIFKENYDWAKASGFAKDR